MAFHDGDMHDAFREFLYALSGKMPTIQDVTPVTPPPGVIIAYNPVSWDREYVTHIKSHQKDYRFVLEEWDDGKEVRYCVACEFGTLFGGAWRNANQMTEMLMFARAAIEFAQ